MHAHFAPKVFSTRPPVPIVGMNPVSGFGVSVHDPPNHLSDEVPAIGLLRMVANANGIECTVFTGDSGLREAVNKAGPDFPVIIIDHGAFTIAKDPELASKVKGNTHIQVWEDHDLPSTGHSCFFMFLFGVKLPTSDPKFTFGFGLAEAEGDQIQTTYGWQLSESIGVNYLDFKALFLVGSWNDGDGTSTHDLNPDEIVQAETKFIDVGNKLEFMIEYSVMTTALGILGLKKHIRLSNPLEFLNSFPPDVEMPVWQSVYIYTNLATRLDELEVNRKLIEIFDKCYESHDKRKALQKSEVESIKSRGQIKLGNKGKLLIVYNDNPDPADPAASGLAIKVAETIEHDGPLLAVSNGLVRGTTTRCLVFKPVQTLVPSSHYELLLVHPSNTHPLRGYSSKQGDFSHKAGFIATLLHTPEVDGWETFNKNVCHMEFAGHTLDWE